MPIPTSDAAELHMVVRKFICPASAIVAQESGVDKGPLARGAKASKLELRLPVVANSGDIEAGTPLKPWN
eukprot:11930860-Alexandrium_andersonii.AAC.1